MSTVEPTAPKFAFEPVRLLVIGSAVTSGLSKMLLDMSKGTPFITAAMTFIGTTLPMIAAAEAARNMVTPIKTLGGAGGAVGNVLKGAASAVTGGTR